MTKDDLMMIAWRDFCVWAAQEPDAVAAFNAETGRSFQAPPKNVLERMIDRATGKIEDDARAFVDWVTDSQWGIESAPAAYRKARGLDAARPPPG